MSDLQPSLFDAPAAIVQPKWSKEATIQERFESFHTTNPGVYQALVALVMEMRQRGVRRYGMKGLFEILRWRYAMRTQGDEYKLNNIFTSRYTRKMVEEYAELRDFFELRELKAE